MNEKKNCKIVQDLLPNYIEKLTTEETNQYIQEHLKECNECKTVFENMQKEFKVEKNKREEKEVKYLKKYKTNLKILKTTLLIIVAIFLVSIGRKMIIISNLSNKAEKYITSSNYHRISYVYSEGRFGKVETYKLGDKKKLNLTTYQEGGEKVTTVYATNPQADKFGNIDYKANTYEEDGTRKTAKLNHKATINEMVNKVYTKDMLHLLYIAVTTKLTETTYNGKECYFIANFRSINTSAAEEMYIDKETGLALSIVSKDEEMSDGKIVRNPISEYVYEFDCVTEEEFIEPDISEYEVEEM